MSRVAAHDIERPALRWERANAAPVEYAVWPERPMTIGRDPTNMIAIESPFVSKAHALFQYLEGQYVIEDLDSANGTRVNGVAVSGAAGVALGDVIEIGDERLVFFDRAGQDAKGATPGLSKNVKLAMAAGGTLLVLVIVFALLIAGAPTSGERRATVTGGASVVASGSALRQPDATESQAVRDVVQRAQGAGVNPVDALCDEAMVQYRVGRLRDASQLFAAAVARDARNDLARSRLQATNAELARAIDAHVAGAERAVSQLRLDAAAAEWEKVLLLTDPNDPRHAQAEAAIERLRAHR